MSNINIKEQQEFSNLPKVEQMLSYSEKTLEADRK